ncbi:unnamed protein product [Lactuca virosa]|uniref:HAT C-terminal dimerisation domain-containing protein n=1 Tax=Lactuca virosa TaxID=75947 RepID=A0AAU9M969_9ASTR|nr:unnamed protein product [Lactuca virosa]
MKKAKLDSTIEPAVVVAPQDVDLEEDDIDVVDVDVKIEGEENDGRRYGGFLKDFQLVMMGGKGQNVRDAQKDTSVKQKMEHEACQVVDEKKSDMVFSKSTKEMLKEFTTYESTNFVLSQKSQLEMYLDEPRSDIDEDLDVLSFWKAHKYRYPEPASMARDILSIPHDIVEAIICTKDWLFATKGDEELSLEELTDDVMQMDNKYTQVEDV